MARQTLNPKILKKLSEKLNITEGTVRSNISHLRRDYPSCTLNAIAQIYARKNGLTVQQQLTAEDKATLPHLNVEKSTVKISTKARKSAETIKKLINYENTDYFIRGHINEVNKAYTKGCYTAAYILLRKVIENLILDILQAKYPSKDLKNLELYWDTSQKRFKDFSIILKNLLAKKDDFGPAKSKAIQKLYELAKKFKGEANDKAHSWFHLVTGPKELEDLDPQTMIELIKNIEN